MMVMMIMIHNMMFLGCNRELDSGGSRFGKRWTMAPACTLWYEDYDYDEDDDDYEALDDGFL